MPPEFADTESPKRLARVVDFRVPLIWLIGALGTVSWGLLSMYFSVNQLVNTVGELKIEVKSGNTSVVAVAGELALLKFRLSNAEDSIKRIGEKGVVK